MTAVQAVIFLAVGLAAAGVNLYAGHLRARIDSLDELLSDRDFAEPDRLAAALRETEAAYRERTSLPETVFDYARLEAVNRVALDDVRLVYLDIRAARVHLTAETADLKMAGKHRAALLQTGYFTNATYGPVSKRANGRYQYDLYLETTP